MFIDPEKYVFHCGCFILNGSKDILLVFDKEKGFYMPPGGPLGREDVADTLRPHPEDLERAAIRNVHKQLGKDCRLGKLRYLGTAELPMPDGRKLFAIRFLTSLAGTIRLNGDYYAEARYIPLDGLAKEKVSEDCLQFREQIKKA